MLREDAIDLPGDGLGAPSQGSTARRSWIGTALRGAVGILDAIAERDRVGLAIILAWACLIYPAALLRGFHYEEGLVVGLARAAVEEGYWLDSHVSGLRFVERPNLLAWVVAAIYLVTHSLAPVLVRLPTLLSLVGGALMVRHLVRDHVSRQAGLFAALAFLTSPMLLQKIVTAEPDLPLSVLLFSAFVLWWRGLARRGPSFARWSAIGAVLALGALMKGPQPLAYFALGVGAFVVVNRHWRQLPGLIWAGIIAALPMAAWYLVVFHAGDEAQWASYMRISQVSDPLHILLSKLRFVAQLALEFLPATILVVPFTWRLLRKPEPTESRKLALALLSYAGVATVVILLWPSEVGSRYAMPAVPAVAALAGLSFDGVRRLAHRAVEAGCALMLGFLAYQMVASWIVLPADPWLGQSARLQAAAIEAAMATEPGPINRWYFDGSNMVAHLRTPIRSVLDMSAFGRLHPPAWILVRGSELPRIAAARPDLKVVRHVTLDGPTHLELIRLLPR